MELREAGVVGNNRRAHETRIVFVSVGFDGRRRRVMKLQNPTNVVFHILNLKLPSGKLPKLNAKYFELIGRYVEMRLKEYWSLSSLRYSPMMYCTVFYFSVLNYLYCSVLLFYSDYVPIYKKFPTSFHFYKSN